MARREEAIAYYQRKIEENVMDPEPHYNIAVLYRSMGNHEMHARHVRIATLTKAGGPAPWNEMGLALMEKGDALQAQETFKQVIEYWPTFPWSYVNMSVLKARKGQYEEAVAFCMKALEHASQDPALHRNTARVYEAMGKTEEALVHYQHALALEPSNAEVARRISLLSLSKHQTAAATAHYEHYRQLTGQQYDLKL